MDLNLPKAAVELLDDDLMQCLSFILELDKLKSVKRRSPLLDNSRVETDAEHSWHSAMIALLLTKYSDTPVNCEKVVSMMLIHDIVEIDAGDIFLYDSEQAKTQDEREMLAAKRLYGLLPKQLGNELFTLWQEFEAGETAEAKFAKGLDRLQPLLLNYFSGGGTWNLPGAHRENVLQRKAVIQNLSPKLWEFAQILIEDGVAKGRLRQQDKPREVNEANPSMTSLFSVFSELTIVDMQSAPEAMKTAAQEFEVRFQHKFTTLTRLPKNLLDFLHQPNATNDNCNCLTHARLSIASNYDKSIITHIDTMSRIANLCRITKADNVEFFDAVISIYEGLRGGLDYLTRLDDTYCIAPEREGRMIAERLAVLPVGRNNCPNAKRIPYQEGLIVGHDLVAPDSTIYQRCVIVDGAIASGSTLIAMIEMLRESIQEFHIFSAHATQSSVRALAVYATAIDIKLYLNLGHVSGQLNHKRYALHEDGSLVIGDLGDLISPALE